MDNPVYIGKNDKIMITARTFNNKPYIDIRKCFKSIKYNKIVPTKKGICISKEEFEELINNQKKLLNNLENIIKEKV